MSDDPRATPTRREAVAAFIPASPFVGRVGLRLVELARDRAELELSFDARLTTIGDVVHGGAIATMVDTAAVAAAWADDERPDSFRGSTVNMNIDYVAAATGTDLRAVARVVRRGGTLCFCAVDVTGAGGTLIACGSVIYRYG